MTAPTTTTGQPRRRKSRGAAETRLPVAHAAGATVKLDGTKVVLEVIFLDARGEQVVFPLLIEAGLACAMGVQLDKSGSTLKGLIGRRK